MAMEFPNEVRKMYKRIERLDHKLGFNNLEKTFELICGTDYKKSEEYKIYERANKLL